ncbi:MAG: M20/M25/M40 family metallo-hydrolase [Planctomycetota bacterium]
MRRARLILFAALSTAVGAAAAEATDRARVVVIPATIDAATKEKLIASCEIWTDVAPFLVGCFSDADLPWLAALGVPARVFDDVAASDTLVVVGVADPGDEAELARKADVLYSAQGWALARIPDQSPLLPHDLAPHRPGRASLHDGVFLVRRTRMSPHRARGASSFLGSPAYDARVQAIADQVSQLNLQTTVDHLSNDYYTRVASRTEAFAVRDWLVASYQALGLATSTHSYNGDSDNVIGDLPGTKYPDRILIVGGHYDSVNWNDYPNGRSPGADDNASGTAAVLEMARILSQYQFKNTIRFMAFCSEEEGLVGSNAYATMMRNQNADIVAMFNTDMNAYKASGDTRSLDFVEDDASPELIQFGIDITNLYLPGFKTNRGHLGGGTSDHKSFDDVGFPAVFYFEDLGSYSPYIHTANDTIGTSANDFTRGKMITQSLIAALATVAGLVDLDLQHAALGDQEDSAGPYVVVAKVSSLIGTNVTGVTLSWRTGGAFTDVPMLPTKNPGEWIAQIPGQAAGSTVSYYLNAVDDQGNREWLPDGASAGDATFTFKVGHLTTIYATSFENGAEGWASGGTNQNDWARGTPAGKSNDPSSAFDGTYAWGNDLGAGSADGEYENNANNYLDSPDIDCQGFTNVILSYRRHLAVEDGYYDQAKITVEGQTVWQNAATPGGGSNHHIDTDWVLHEIDISPQAGNNPAVEVRFTLKADGGLTFGGWNVDDLKLVSLSPAPTPALVRDTAFVSAGTGGSVHFALDLGAPAGNAPYVLLAGISGTSPGFDVNGAHVPLNIDAVTFLFLRVLPLLPGFAGTLDPAGTAQATLPLPPLDASAAGTTLSFAGLSNGPWLATNAVDVLIIP